MPDWEEQNPDFDELELRHKHMLCSPSFEALRQYEWIRSSGKYNMLTEGRKVVEEMKKLGFFEAFEWLLLCQEEKVFFGTVYSTGMERWKKEVPGNWFDAEFLKGIKKARKRELREQLRQLQDEIDELEDQ
jgi:hypothetical protein